MTTHPTFIVTGGAGFIGAELVRQLVNNTDANVINVDKLSYAGDLTRLDSIANNPRYRFEKIDIGDRQKMGQLLEQVKPNGVFHLAAESHVDRSISNPERFATNNTIGTLDLLDVTRAYWLELSDGLKQSFRFVNVSTDEVYGSLGPTGKFTEQTPFAPRSPYSASKAAADHFASAYFETYGLPVITTHASNNYGPYQFPEKLLPLALTKALAGDKVPVYGNGTNVRDWLHVEDHARGLQLVMQHGRSGETYLIGGNNELTNTEVLDLLLGLLNELQPGAADYRELITFVTDRPGHDFRYAVDSSKAERELGWTRDNDFENGLRETIKWYLDNQSWIDAIRSSRYDLGRLGSLEATAS